MSVKILLAAAAATALLLGGCASDSKPADEEASGNASANLSASTEASAPPLDQPPARAANAAAPASYTLAAKGLAPGLTFGMAQGPALAAAAAAFGKPTGREHNDECGEGPMDLVSFHDLQLGFQEGRLAGWSLGGPQPALHTAGGLSVGAPRSALGDAPVDEDSSIGPEFEIGGVGGFLDEQNRVMSLWAGYPCQFR